MLKIENLDYTYENYDVLSNINIHVNKGETVGIIGRSGVGKTTLFQLITGLIPHEHGTISLDDSTVTEGKISYMLQKDMLFEHYTVIQNIILPRIIAGDSKEKARKLANDLLTQFDLKEWADYYPHALSGGMRQRIAFLRTAAFQRKWLLLDEAFSALDAFTRRNLHKWFINTRKKLDWSALLITHDVDEALILCDRIYVLAGQPGKIIHEVHVEIESTDIKNIIFEPEFLSAKQDLLDALNENET